MARMADDRVEWEPGRLHGFRHLTELGSAAAWLIGSGRPLILLHGFTGSGSHMMELGLVRAFAEQGHRVILPDLRGHGDSAKPHDLTAYPPDVFANDGLALVEHLKTEQALRNMVAAARQLRADVG